LVGELYLCWKDIISFVVEGKKEKEKEKKNYEQQLQKMMIVFQNFYHHQQNSIRSVTLR